MKNIRNVLNEVKGEKAHKQAVAMGLKYKGFGYWLDPSSGEVAYKTENDTLVPVEPDVESELAGKGAGEEAGGAPSGGFGNPGGVGGSFNTFQNKQIAMGTGMNIQGIADNGLAQAPNSDNGRWEPGPDGDNMIDDQELKSWNKPPKDAYVGKKNYFGWTAGPDGDNYSTMTMQDMMKAALNVNDKSVDRDGNIYEGEDMGHKTMFRKMIGADAPSPSDPSHVMKAAQVYQDQSDTGKGVMMRDVMRGGNNTGNFNVAMDRLPDKMAKRDEGKNRVKSLNASLKELVSDPNYDMSQKGEELGSGMFGTVYESKDGKNVIKEGKLTRKELAILHKLKDVKAFPNLINAEVSSDFQSADDLFGAGLDDDSINSGMAFFDDIPFADGKMVMSKMAGRPYNEASKEMTEEQKEKFVQKLWNARGAMHKLGISHNDMHGENFFVDDEGNPSILDLGLANDDPLSALMEAIGGVTGKDYQFETDAKMGGGALASLLGHQYNFVPEALKERIATNMKTIREMMEDEAFDYIDPPDEDTDDPDNPSLQGMHEWGQNLDTLMKGGLRLKDGHLNDLRDKLPFLEDNNKVLDLLKALYDNVSDTETGQRMTNAYDKLKKDRATVALANLTRKKQGKPEIEDRLKNVLEPDD